MEQRIAPDCGVTKISNPKTLQRWIDFGWYQKLINEGFIFAIGCGRFKKEICTCSACRKKPNQTLKLIIETL